LPSSNYIAFADASACANSDPRGDKDDQKVAEFTDGEYCTAEYQAERSTDITQQRENRVRLLFLDIGVLQLREENLRAHVSQHYRIKPQYWQNE